MRQKVPVRGRTQARPAAGKSREEASPSCQIKIKDAIEGKGKEGERAGAASERDEKPEQKMIA